jgi:4-hydroxy-2-oxoheptanedioate aldolase
MVNTAAEARSVLSFAKFPPIGIRGQGSAFPGFEFGFSTPSEYVANANESVLTMVQIESVQGLQNVEEICQVEGVGA